MNYMLVEMKASNGACRLGTIENVEKEFQLRIGVPRATNFPTDACFRMNDDFPKDIGLTDALHNRSRLVVASERLKKFLEAIPGALVQNEILPVAILNHKGRREKAQYAVVNQLNHPACLNEKACVGTKSKLKPAMFQVIEKMVLDPARVPADRMLFRAAEYPQAALIRRDLAEKLDAETFTGITFHEIEGYEF
jgi:hypothetical protein